MNPSTKAPKGTPVEPWEYCVKTAEPGRWAMLLSERLTVEVVGMETIDSLLLDTFDWRLFQAGCYLEQVQGAGNPTLRLGERNSRRMLCVAVCEQETVDFFWNLPAGSLRDTLAPLIRKRVLLPKANLRGRRWDLAQRNQDGKITLRMQVEEIIATEQANKYRECRFRLLPLRGYRQECKKTLRLVSAWPELKPAQHNLPDAALIALGLNPGRKPGRSGPIPPVSADTRSDQAVQHLLLGLWGEMRAQEAGILADLDSEFLHEYRIGIRKTRSALKQLPSLYPEKVRRRFTSGFAWLGKWTGPVRDWDVYLLHLPQYRELLGDPLGDSLDVLLGVIRRKKKAAHQRLAARLRGRRYQSLVRDYETFLREPARPSSRMENAARPVIDLANERIWRAYQKVLHGGRSITDHSPAEKLHDLRKKAKELRYLVELFEPLYPEDPLSELTRILKKLQDNLGTFNDLEVQSVALLHWRDDPETSPHLTPETARALETLAALLLRKQQKYRRDFARQFSAFDRPRNHALYKKLFRSRRSG